MLAPVGHQVLGALPDHSASRLDVEMGRNRHIHRGHLSCNFVYYIWAYVSTCEMHRSDSRPIKLLTGHSR